MQNLPSVPTAERPASFIHHLNKSALDCVLDYQELLVGAVADIRMSEEDFNFVRHDLLNNPAYGGLAPSFLRRTRTTSAFWSFAKGIDSSWEPRRVYIRQQFEPLLDYLEHASPTQEAVLATLAKLESGHVQDVWAKANARCMSDPEGAVTAARTLLESTCKLILEDAKEVANADEDHVDLPKLYKRVAALLNLSPSQHSEAAFKRILGGCTSVVEGLGTLRNKVGDAHGKGRNVPKPAPRHAMLAVNLSGAMASYLVATWTEVHRNVAR